MVITGIKHKTNMDQVHSMIVLVILGCKIHLSSASATREEMPWGVAFSGEYCDYEVFRAQCSPGQIIMMQSAVYGHIRVGKCIETDIGYLGCQENVIHMFENRCSGKQSCELSVDDESLRQLQPCIKGIDVYLDASYMCINSVPPQSLCSPLSATAKMSYISSVQIYNAPCSSDNSLQISASKGQSIELSLVDLSPNDGAVAATGVGLLVDGDTGETKSLTLSQGAHGDKLISQSNSITLLMDESHDKKFVMSYRAIGCPDLTPPPGTTVTRNGEEAEVLCTYTQVSWHLTCRQDRRLGVIGNCSRPEPVLIVTTRLPKESTEGLALQKDVIYLIIVCATIFLSVLVITVGCVVLKRARIQKQSEQSKAESEWNIGSAKMILLPKPRPSSDYLTPRYDPDGQGKQVPIYDTPLPDPPLINTGSIGKPKRNNEDEFNNTVSTNSTDYTRKYFVLDKDYMNTQNLLDA